MCVYVYIYIYIYIHIYIYHPPVYKYDIYTNWRRMLYIYWRRMLQDLLEVVGGAEVHASHHWLRKPLQHAHLQMLTGLTFGDDHRG